MESIAQCQIECFPNSFNTKLGKKFVAKSLSWFLSKDNRFLFHIENEGIVVGFCGGFAPQFYGDGSSSGMLQHAFKEAVIGVLKRPWLFLNKEMKAYYPFIIRNIKKKLGLRKTTAVTPKPENFVFNPSVGLVVIGVHPSYRGKGVFEMLMSEFENQAKKLAIHTCILSVRADNTRAIAAYKKVGWQIKEEKENSLIMSKDI
ncbi:MAG: GNAT family N-acetyltransferase [Chitinophagales bacterium]|nr:GNAT family N-acetyltransferase [Chitinophagales bacterium]